MRREKLTLASHAEYHRGQSLVCLIIVLNATYLKISSVHYSFLLYLPGTATIEEIPQLRSEIFEEHVCKLKWSVAVGW